MGACAIVVWWQRLGCTRRPRPSWPPSEWPSSNRTAAGAAAVRRWRRSSGTLAVLARTRSSSRAFPDNGAAIALLAIVRGCAPLDRTCSRGPLPERPARWSYKTVAQQSNAFGFRFSLRRPPTRLASFSRSACTLEGRGADRVTVHSPGGTRQRARLPFRKRICDSHGLRDRMPL